MAAYKGFTMNGGPVAYTSDDSPQPLTLEEEATLAFASWNLSCLQVAR